ncbi:MAG: hypothetical protein LBV53_03000 [Mycoplasmataceae bacterium]|jgi:hypothetical protein|nr:hypothetical protein [Mycoplasmataceae bacterium]
MIKITKFDDKTTNNCFENIESITVIINENDLVVIIRENNEIVFANSYDNAYEFTFMDFNYTLVVTKTEEDDLDEESDDLYKVYIIKDNKNTLIHKTLSLESAKRIARDKSKEYNDTMVKVYYNAIIIAEYQFGKLKK